MRAREPESVQLRSSRTLGRSDLRTLWTFEPSDLRTFGPRTPSPPHPRTFAPSHLRTFIPPSRILRSEALHSQDLQHEYSAPPGSFCLLIRRSYGAAGGASQGRGIRHPDERHDYWDTYQ